MQVHSDSKLVVRQINGKNKAKEEEIKRYLGVVKEHGTLRKGQNTPDTSGRNFRANALSKLAIFITPDLRQTLYNERLMHPSTEEEDVMHVETTPYRMDPNHIAFLWDAHL